MEIRSSLKRKSFLALAMYMALLIAIIGTVSYLVVEPPIRDQLEKNLDLRTQIIAAEIKEPLNSSLGILQRVWSVSVILMNRRAIKKRCCLSYFR